MLSRRDIEKELGKGINIHPLYTENIKENSINLSVSTNCWTEDSATVYWDSNTFSINKPQQPKRTWDIKKGDNCIVDIGSSKHHNKQLLLLPHTTTIIETMEVIGVEDYIGGALHSKVGVVAKGIGHIGTMLGPGYCGHLMVSLHNITNDVIALPVGSTFVSVSFHYLDTKVTRTSFTTSGHVDKFGDLGIKTTEKTRDYITQDWKSNINGIREKMLDSESYKQHAEHLKKMKRNEYKKYFSLKNIISSILVILAFFIILSIATYIDNKTNTNVWVNRFWDVGCSGIVCSLLLSFYKFLKSE